MLCVCCSMVQSSVEPILYNNVLHYCSGLLFHALFCFVELSCVELYCVVQFCCDIVGIIIVIPVNISFHFIDGMKTSSSLLYKTKR